MQKSRMVIHIYSDASYISEPEAQSGAIGYFVLGPKYNIPMQEIPPDIGPVHVECSIMRNVTASSMEAELGGLFEKCQKATSMSTALADIGHQQPPTPVATENTAANSTVNRTGGNISSNRHETLLGQRQNPKKPFPHIVGRGKVNPSGLCHKTPPDMAP